MVAVVVAVVAGHVRTVGGAGDHLQAPEYLVVHHAAVPGLLRVEELRVGGALGEVAGPAAPCLLRRTRLSDVHLAEREVAGRV